MVRFSFETASGLDWAGSQAWAHLWPPEAYRGSMGHVWRQQQGFIASESRQVSPTASCLTRQAALGATLLGADDATAHAIAAHNLLLPSTLLVGLRQLVHPLPARPAIAVLKCHWMQLIPDSSASRRAAQLP